MANLTLLEPDATQVGVIILQRPIGCRAGIDPLRSHSETHLETVPLLTARLLPDRPDRRAEM